MELNQGLPVPAEILESKPPRGPKGAHFIAALAAGAYTDIVGIYGLAEAVYGDTVNIQVAIKNLCSYGIYIAATADIAGVTNTVSPVYDGVDAGATYYFTISFTMPNNDITLTAWSWYWTGSEWLYDDHEAVTIKLKVLTPQFSGFGISDYSKI